MWYNQQQYPKIKRDLSVGEVDVFCGVYDTALLQENLPGCLTRKTFNLTDVIITDTTILKAYFRKVLTET